MGLLISTFFGYKRPRLAYGVFNLRYFNKNNQVSPFKYCDWKNLPYVALVQIYRCLPDNDKFNLSLTCKAWSQAFSRPEVWRHVKFYFNGVDDWRALRFAESLTSGLRHLVIDCQSTPDLFSDEPWTSVSTYNLYTFLETLLEHRECKLVALRLINMNRISPSFQRDTKLDVVNILGDFLSLQTNLKVLDLTCAGFTSKQGFKVLSRATLGSGSTIAVLSITELFSSVDTQSFNICMQSFTNLSALTLSYQCMSDDLLDILAVCGTLDRLNVFVPNFTGVSPTSSSIWEKLKRSLPWMEAHYRIDQSLQCIDDLTAILVPGIPLAVLEFVFGCDLTDFDWYGLCVYIPDNFKNYLRILVIMLSLENNWMIGMLHGFLDGFRMLREIHIIDTCGDSSLQRTLMMSVRERSSRARAVQLRIFTLNGKEVPL